MVLRQLPVVAAGHRPHGDLPRRRKPERGLVSTAENKTVQYIRPTSRRSSPTTSAPEFAFNLSPKKRRPAAVARRTRPDGTNYAKDSEFPELERVGQRSTACITATCVRRAWRLLPAGSARVGRLRRAALPLDDDQQLDYLDVPVGAPAWHRLHQHPHELKVTAGQARPLLRPGRRHHLRNVARHAPLQGRRPDGLHRAGRPERRSASARHPPLGTRR